MQMSRTGIPSCGLLPSLLAARANREVRLSNAGSYEDDGDHDDQEHMHSWTVLSPLHLRPLAVGLPTLDSRAPRWPIGQRDGQLVAGSCRSRPRPRPLVDRLSGRSKSGARISRRSAFALAVLHRLDIEVAAAGLRDHRWTLRADSSDGSRRELAEHRRVPLGEAWHVKDLLSYRDLTYRPLLFGVEQAPSCVQETNKPEEVHGSRRRVFSEQLLEAASADSGCGSDVVEHYRKMMLAVHESQRAIDLSAKLAEI